MRRGNATPFEVAPVTMSLLMLNIGLYIVSAKYSEDFMEIDSDVLRKMYGSMREGLWEDEWLRLIAPNFLHGGLIHIGLNMWTLWAIGAGAEVHFGSNNYGTIYLLSGVAGFCFSQIFGGVLAIGASASLFGIMGAYLAIKVFACPVLKNAWRNKDVRKTAGFLAVQMLVYISGAFGNIDNWGHFGGLIFGTLLGSMFEIWRKSRRMSVLGIAGCLILFAGLVCAARWSVFSPDYHVHMALLAEEEKRPQDEKAERAEALKWARIWHKAEWTQALLEAYDARKWKIDEARTIGYTYLHWRFPPWWRTQEE